MTMKLNKSFITSKTDVIIATYVTRLGIKMKKN